MSIIIEVLLEAAIDCLKMLPILYIAYLLMEFIEHKASDSMHRAIQKVGHAGPLIGAALGLIPQCGFSGAIAGLYAGGVATLGTLISVFMATSDEMLPLLISNGAGIGLIVKLLAGKFVCGLAAGFLIDCFLTHRSARTHKPKTADAHEIHELCEREGCSCHRHNLFFSAAIHCFQVLLIIFLVSFGLSLLFELGGSELLSRLLPDIPVVSELVTGLIGLIPSCSASVLLTELYLTEGIIGLGPLMSGLFVNAGTGLLVLFRLHHNKKKNFQIVLLLYACGVLSGLLLGLIL